MPDFDDIRRGLAAQLRTVLPETEGHVSAYFRTAPLLPTLQVAGVNRMEKSTYRGVSRSYRFLIEGVFSLGDEIRAQRQLDGLIDDVATALEADQTPTGALFSRYQDDNTVLAGQPAAAGSVAFIDYLGAINTTFDGTTDRVLSATWVFEVQT